MRLIRTKKPMLMKIEWAKILGAQEDQPNELLWINADFHV